MGEVIDFASAADEARRAKADEKLRFAVEKSGEFAVLLVDGHGRPRPLIVMPPDEALRLLETLVFRVRRKKYEAMGIAVELPGERAFDRDKRPCHRTRNGGKRSVGGCRRRANHAGRCRDAKGDYEPAICSHIGFKFCITRSPTNEWPAFKSCNNCHQNIGPVLGG